MPWDPDVSRWAQKLDILSGRPQLGTMAPYRRDMVANLADSILADSAFKNQTRTLARARFFQSDNPERYPDSLARKRGLFGSALFRYPADVYTVRVPDFDLHVSPVFSGQLGKDKYNDSTRMFINTRGVEVRGTIANRVSFYTVLADNQVRLPGFVENYGNYTNRTYPRFPNEGFVKPLSTRGFDFITARGHIAFQATKHFQFQFGQDRVFAGDGIRSLILSDWAPAMPYLRVDTRVWKIRYTNLFGQLKASARRPGDAFIPNKWLAYHQLDIDLLPKLTVGFFESVIFAPGDSNKRGLYDLSYLNPLIFYRFVEQYNGSSDNSLVGMNFRYDAFRQLRFYGQLVFDEILFSNLKAQNGWWSNKYALQGGVRWVNPFGLDGVDLQGEYNFIRPFTYTHRSHFLSYTHFNMPLAHPIGANVKEMVGRAEVQILPTLFLRCQLLLMRYGADEPARNFGNDVNRSYDDRRAQDFGLEVGSGVLNKVTSLDAGLSWMPWHRVFLDLNVWARERKTVALAKPERTLYVSLGLRWNFYRREFGI